MPKGSGLDKRQATIQLCIRVNIRAEGPQVVRIALIFRGRGLRLSAAEKHVYRSLSKVLVVYFQPNAWADESVMIPKLVPSIPRGHQTSAVRASLRNG